MLATAPAVLQRRQNIDSTSAGKLALAAMAKASPTMNATFCPLKLMPSSTATIPSRTVASRATRSCSSGLAHPLRTTLTHSSWDNAAAPDRETRHDGQNGRERHGGDEPEERGAAEVLREQRRGHVAARLDALDHVRPHQHHRAEAE